MRPKSPAPQYYKVSDDLELKMPKEQEWSAEVVDGINKALKSAHEIAAQGFSSSSNSEIVEVDINIGSPWRALKSFTGNFVGGSSGSGSFTSFAKYMKHYDGSVEFTGYFTAALTIGWPAQYWNIHAVMTLPPEIMPPFSCTFPIWGSTDNVGTTYTPAYAFIDTSTSVLYVFGTQFPPTGPAEGAPGRFYLNFRYMAADPRPLVQPGFPVSFKIKSNSPPVGVIPIAAMEVNQKVARPSPMLAMPDWSFSSQGGKPVITIKNLGFSGFNCIAKVWFLVIYQ